MRFPRSATAVLALGAACTTQPVGIVDDGETDNEPCRGGYLEAADDANGELGLPEDAGFSLNDASNPRPICGLVDPANAADGSADIDVFRFDIDREMDLRIDLTAPLGSGVAGLSAQLWTGDGRFISSAGFRGGFALVSARRLPRGQYLVSVRADAPGPSEPLSYTIVARPNVSVCGPAAAPAYVESGDGAGSRGNDMISVTNDAITIFAETVAADGPETTAIDLGTGDLDGILGVATGVAPDGDSYRDRDVFEIAVGPSVNELGATIQWTADVDLDAYLFIAGELTGELTGGEATRIGSADERFEVSVDPSSSLWLWIGQSVDGGTADADYELTVCGRRYVP